VRILRNRLEHGRGPAVHIGTPGAQWDAFAGVEHMISREILVADNVVSDWAGPAVQLDGSRNIEIRGNIVEGAGDGGGGGRGLVTNRREPKDLAGKTILIGNTGVRLRGNRLPGIQMAAGDPAPIVEP
jgi:hypothetical protein